MVAASQFHGRTWPHTRRLVRRPVAAWPVRTHSSLLCPSQQHCHKHRSTIWKLGMNGIPPYLETHD